MSSAPNVTKNYGNLDPDVRLSLNRSYLGFRYLSSKNNEMGSKKFTGKMRNPGETVTKALTRYREAGRLQIEAFWKINYLVILGAGGLVLWRVLFGIANTFIGFSEGMENYGFLALSSAVVAFTGLYFRARFTVNPDSVCRMAMRRLNTSAGLLEVMCAPLTGTDLRAFVMSGGAITLKNFQLSLRSKRCFLFSLYLVWKRKAWLVLKSRRKKARAMAATKEFEDRDEMEDEENCKGTSRRKKQIVNKFKSWKEMRLNSYVAGLLLMKLCYSL